MSTYIPADLRQAVIVRANYRCEYCLLHQEDEPIYSHEVDHIIAEKHSGLTVFENLAYACFYCNRYKGSDIASIDPVTGDVTPLFNPRTQQWRLHFTLDGAMIMPLSAVARTTAKLLKFNRPRIVQRRIYLIQAKHYPREPQP